MSKCSICNQFAKERNLTEIGLGTNVFQCEKCWIEKGKMKTYRVQQLAHTWHEITVEAETLEEAHKKGSMMIMNGNGVQVPDLFEWQDETLSMEKGE